MEKLLLGIEHLFTGIKVQVEGEAVITFVRESASVVMAVSTGKMKAYHDATQCYVESVAMTKEEEKYGKEEYRAGAVEYYADKLPPRMREVELGAIEPLQYRMQRANNPDVELVPVPAIVDVALMNRFGKEAASIKHRMHWDGLNGCWLVEWQGMLLGIEQDGYIHS